MDKSTPVNQPLRFPLLLAFFIIGKNRLRFNPLLSRVVFAIGPPPLQIANHFFESYFE